MKLIRVLYQFLVRNWVWIYPVIETIYSYLKRTIKMERIGLFTPQQEQVVTDALKTFVKPKNKFLGWIQAFGLKYLIKGIDNFGLDRIGGEWKRDLIPIIDVIWEKKYEQARQMITDLLNKRIDFRNTDEEWELRFFDSITRTIATALDYLIVTKVKKENS
jgi:hypothetical protein